MSLRTSTNRITTARSSNLSVRRADTETLAVLYENHEWMGGLFAQLDHTYLNDIEGLENPTSEAIAIWMWRRLQPKLPGLARIVIRETCTAGCVYQGQDE